MHTTVALIFGGRSGEHGISCITAGGILSAIDRDRFTVIPIGIAEDGRFRLVSDDPKQWQIRDSAAPSVPMTGDEILMPTRARRDGQPNELRVIRDGRVEHCADVDVFFPVLHGPNGEDGTIQGLFDLLDLPYVGSGVFGSSAAMDKDVTKRLLQQAGIRVADGVVVHADTWDERRAELLPAIQELPLPLFIKPARAGSSLGVSRIEDLSALDQALADAFAVDPKVLVEAGINGREVECGALRIVPGEPVRTTLPGEVSVGEDLDFYDYGSKYFGKGTVSITVPAAIPDEVAEQVRAIAARTFDALDLESLARIDVFVEENGQVTVNEVNTMPGFTPFSMFPVLWEHMGTSYTDLITLLIESALNKRVGLR